MEKVDFAQFRELLQSLENSHTNIRVRMLGNPWTQFCTLILLSESAMILQDGSERKIIMNLRNVVEFELGESVDGLAGNTPYEVTY